METTWKAAGNPVPKMGNGSERVFYSSCSMSLSKGKVGIQKKKHLETPVMGVLSALGCWP